MEPIELGLCSAGKTGEPCRALSLCNKNGGGSRCRRGGKGGRLEAERDANNAVV